MRAGNRIPGIEVEQRSPSEAWLRFQAQVLDAVGQAIVVTEPDGTIVFWNKSAETLYGWGAPEAMGRKMDDVAPAEMPREQLLEMEDRLRSGESWTGEFLVRRRDGGVFPAAGTSSPVYGEKGELIAIVSIAKDITAQKNAEELLRQKEVQLSTAQQLAHFGSWEWDIATNKITWSDELYRIFGCEPQEFSPAYDDVQARTHPDDQIRIQQIHTQALQKGGRVSYERRITRPDGMVRILYTIGEVVSDESGKPVRVYGATQDVTEAKLAQLKLQKTTEQLHRLSQQLIEVQELERRHLARELHDEIGQVLTATKIMLQSVQQSPEGSAVAERLQESVGSIDLLLQQVRRISLVLRPPLLDDLGLLPALRSHLDQIAKRSGLEVRFATPETWCRLDPKIETACFRVVQEALTNVVRHARAKRVNVELDRHEQLHVEVRDDGIGFDIGKALQRARRGRTAGLLGMKERASLLGGSVVIQSAPGEGTELRASFPLTEGKP